MSPRRGPDGEPIEDDDLDTWPTVPAPRGDDRRRATRPAGPPEPRPDCGDPACADPDIGNGRGWLPDEPATGAPRPCPTCRSHITPAALAANREAWRGPREDYR